MAEDDEEFTLYEIAARRNCRRCIAHAESQPFIIASCASVGIEYGKSTYQMVVEYFDGLHQREHQRKRRNAT